MKNLLQTKISTHFILALRLIEGNSEQATVIHKTYKIAIIA